MTMTARALFVYGTLRPGGRYWANIERCIEQYDPAMIEGFQLWDLPDGYPAIVSGNGRVFGDLLYITSGYEQEITRIADEIEEYDPDDSSSLFLRESVNAIRLRLPDRRPVPAQTYVFNPQRQSYLRQSATEVPDGDWRAFVAVRDGTS